MRGKQPNCDEPKGLLQQTGNDKMFSEKVYGTPVHKVQLPSGDKGITEKHEHKIPPTKGQSNKRQQSNTSNHTNFKYSINKRDIEGIFTIPNIVILQILL